MEKMKMKYQGISGQGKHSAQEASAATQEAITNFNRRKRCPICSTAIVLEWPVFTRMTGILLSSPYHLLSKNPKTSAVI